MHPFGRTSKLRNEPNFSPTRIRYNRYIVNDLHVVKGEFPCPKRTQNEPIVLGPSGAAGPMLKLAFRVLLAGISRPGGLFGRSFSQVDDPDTVRGDPFHTVAVESQTTATPLRKYR